MSGGLVNLITISTMPEESWLLGVSGVVHWMAAAWMTLAFFIDRRQSVPRRLIKMLGVSLILFIPDTYKPEVSYTSHFVGYGLGVLSGMVWFLLFKQNFMRAEEVEYIYIPEQDDGGLPWRTDEQMEELLKTQSLTHKQDCSTCH